MTTMAKPTIDGVRERARGQVITPTDDGYEGARKVYNAMIDRRPSVVIRAVDVGDVMVAVDYARENGLDLSVRGGSHSVPGFGTCDGGVVIDLSQMKDTYVVQLPTAPVTSHCCSGKDRYILHYETAPGLTAMNYRMRFPAGNNGWVAAGADTPSGYCLGPLGPPQGVCALPKTPRWTFVTDAVQVPPTTVIFEKTKAACPLVRHEPNALQLIC